MKKYWVHLLSVIILAGCVSVPTVEERRQNANDLARQSGWHGTILPTSPYPLQVFLPKQKRTTNTLYIYIEGDGLAWRTRRQASRNPTPIKPLALQLALQDTHAAAYLARPCQYISPQDGCDLSLWTSARFSEDVITSSNAAIELLKQKFNAEYIWLIGYSGGGGVAALVAARRDDVIQLITIAGNLDHVAWTEHHNITPLNRSLNPADAWQDLWDIPQVHLVGADDSNVGVFVAESYAAHFPTDHQPQIRVIKDADHDCCWVEKWQGLLQSISAH